MADTGQESEGYRVGSQPERTSEEQDKQALLLKLAERTVLQAEALAQEITDRARKQSETEGAQIRDKYISDATEEARRIIEAAEQEGATIIQNASATANTERDEILGLAKTERQEIVGNTETEVQEIVGNAQTEGEDVLARANQLALAIISGSKARAESIESNARLRGEFIVKQMSQNVADGIRRAVIETANTMLPALEELGEQPLENLPKDNAEGLSTLERELLEKVTPKEDYGPDPDSAELTPGNGAQPPDKRKPRPSTGSPASSTEGSRRTARAPRLTSPVGYRYASRSSRAGRTPQVRWPETSG